MKLLGSQFFAEDLASRSARQEGICPFLSTMRSSPFDLSRHHYRFILSVPAQGDIAKKEAPFRVKSPRGYHYRSRNSDEKGVGSER